MHPFFVDLELEWRHVDAQAGLSAEAVARCRGDPAMRSDPVLRRLSVGGIVSGFEKVHSDAERMMKLIASGIDGAVPKDEAWHRTLLMRMEMPLPDVRPHLLPAESLTPFDRLRGFRHRECNSYVADLDEARVLEIADTVPEALAAVRADLDRFRCAMDTTPPE